MDQWWPDFVKKIREMAGIPSQLTAIRQSIDQQTESISTADEGNKKNHQVQRERLENILAHYEKSKTNEDAKNDPYYRIQNSARWATWLAFIAASIYAFIAACQLLEYRRQIAAYMDGESAQIIIEFDFDGFSNTRKGNVTISNEGKSVATYVRTPSTGLSPRRWPPHHPLIAYPHWDQVAAEQARLDKQCMENLPIGIPIRPQSKPIVIEELREPTDTEVVNGLLSYGELYVTCYRDIFGRPHHSDLCLFWNGKLLQFRSCESGK